MTTDLVELASIRGKTVTDMLSPRDKKSFGHYLTPGAIARYMAQKIVNGLERESIRLLEPAAGSGILAVAVVDALLASAKPPSEIHLILFEIDSRLISTLKHVVRKMRAKAGGLGIDLSASIRNEDFLLSQEARKQIPIADIVVSNPPYFKLSGKDPRALIYQYAIHGQPNIYGLFMASCASLINAGGKWCFITPRSWTNGAYFSAVRRILVKYLNIEAIHLFDSRLDHFHETEILQEAMITWATPVSSANRSILISTSHGANDLENAKSILQPKSQVIGSDDEKQISISTELSTSLSIFSSTLSTYGLKVSTGPVIAFRSKDFIKEAGSKKTVPLLWMQHVSFNQIRWPIHKKREHVLSNTKSNWMLVSNSPMVILRRFSPKEDQRRVTASAYSAKFPGNKIGLENHLNYIYRPDGRMTIEEARGLAAYLNSSYVDSYFRSIAGSTQINAGELKKLPIPPKQKILELGRKCAEGISLAKMDLLVNEVLSELVARNPISKQG